ncbi:protein of unknown function [Amphibacillus marinus]|uniref:DUF4352 domain-containing protein n=1 Tax=Amphibacillus marinus TaxID=872970 RepID=A0A1H8R3Y7_9BACI|nr:DUF4352 domain-containing protein [Amphibacillus marinus]SEO60848.1 protein of unknown function [Amphibacillus marinus]
MKKILIPILMGFLLLIACSNNNVIIEEVPEENAEGRSNDNDSTKEDEGEDNTSTSDNSEILDLGEVGTLETELGNFQVTPTAFRFEDEIDDGDINETPYNGTFIIVELTIENIDDQTLLSEELVKSANLENLDGAGIAPFLDFNTIENFEGEIEPGASMSGELLFDFTNEEVYEFSFGADYLESLSNEVRWHLNSDDAQ